MEKSILTFNDLPEVVAQLRDEVMSLKSLLAEQRSVNNAKTVDTHVPMSVDEAAEPNGLRLHILKAACKNSISSTRLSA